MAVAAMTANTEFQRIVDEVSRELVTSLHDRVGSFVRTPLLYPSGSSVVVRVEPAAQRFLVSDWGAGYQEAQWITSMQGYARYANVIARAAGVGFDQHAFFVLDVERTQLAGAISTIANCAHDAVSTVTMRAVDRRAHEDAERLFDRLKLVFSPQFVAKDADVVGGSTTIWPVATLVQIGDRRTVFEPVRNHHASIVNASAKFHDIATASNAPDRVAVVKNKGQFGTYLAVLSQAAEVIDNGVPDSVLTRLAHAA